MKIQHRSSSKLSAAGWGSGGMASSANKTHAKMMMIVRREEDKIRRYVHGHRATTTWQCQKLIIDYGLFTANEAITEDVHKIFNELTGMGKPAKVQNYCMPLHPCMTDSHGLYRQRNCPCQSRQKAHIIIKVNAMTEKLLIDKLYEHRKQAFKSIWLSVDVLYSSAITRGISDNITVRSIVGRFLEHTRVYYFG